LNKTKSRLIAVVLAFTAAVCLAASTKLPLWHLRMEAPQYRDQEALRVNVFAGAMQGDLREISVLNQYIGVHISATLPQSRWLPTALLASAALGILASIFPTKIRRVSLVVVSVCVAATVGFAVFQAMGQMHDIGHKRDAHTKLARVHDFDPPFLGTAKIAQFTVTSWLGTGAYLIGAAVALQFGAGILSGKTEAKPSRRPAVRVASTQHSEVLA
jgi:hypothetical protein